VHDFGNKLIEHHLETKSEMKPYGEPYIVGKLWSEVTLHNTAEELPADNISAEIVKVLSPEFLRYEMTISMKLHR
jgi:hypothetical protein